MQIKIAFVLFTMIILTLVSIHVLEKQFRTQVLCGYKNNTYIATCKNNNILEFRLLYKRLTLVIHKPEIMYNPLESGIKFTNAELLLDNSRIADLKFHSPIQIIYNSKKDMSIKAKNVLIEIITKYNKHITLYDTGFLINKNIIELRFKSDNMSNIKYYSPEKNIFDNFEMNHVTANIAIEKSNNAWIIHNISTQAEWLNCSASGAFSDSDNFKLNIEIKNYRQFIDEIFNFFSTNSYLDFLANPKIYALLHQKLLYYFKETSEIKTDKENIFLIFDKKTNQSLKINNIEIDRILKFIK